MKNCILINQTLLCLDDVLSIEAGTELQPYYSSYDMSEWYIPVLRVLSNHGTEKTIIVDNEGSSGDDATIRALKKIEEIFHRFA